MDVRAIFGGCQNNSNGGVGENLRLDSVRPPRFLSTATASHQHTSEAPYMDPWTLDWWYNTRTRAYAYKQQICEYVSLYIRNVKIRNSASSSLIRPLPKHRFDDLRSSAPSCYSACGRCAIHIHFPVVVIFPAVGCSIAIFRP